MKALLLKTINVLLPTKSVEKGVLGFGRIPVTILSSCNFNAISMHLTISERPDNVIVYIRFVTCKVSSKKIRSQK